VNSLSDRAFRVVVYGGKISQVWPAIGDARLDIELLGIPKSLHESFIPAVPYASNGVRKPMALHLFNSNPKLGVVVGMIMGDKDVAKRRHENFEFTSLKLTPHTLIKGIKRNGYGRNKTGWVVFLCRLPHLPQGDSNRRGSFTRTRKDAEGTG